MLRMKRKFIIIISVFLLIYSLYYILNSPDPIDGSANDFQDDELMAESLGTFFENDGFIVIDTLNVNEKSIYFGYYEDGFFEIKLENNDSTESLSLLESWGELVQAYNMEDMLKLHRFKLHWISDSQSEYGTAVLIDYIDTQGYGIFRIWLLDIYNIQLCELAYTDWGAANEIYITRNSHDMMTLEIPLLDIKNTYYFSSDDEVVKYFDYLEIPLNERILYEQEYYFHIDGCQINEDSIVVSYRFKTGACEWIPDLNVTFKSINGNMDAVGAVLEHYTSLP